MRKRQTGHMTSSNQHKHTHTQRHTDRQERTLHTHSYTLSDLAPSVGHVKGEALKCKRFMKFIYVPVKMPTASAGRYERADIGVF